MDINIYIDFILKTIFFIFSIILVTSLVGRVFKYKDRYQGQDMVQSIFIICYGIFIAAVLSKEKILNVENIIETVVLSMFGLLFFILLKYISDKHFGKDVEINKELFFHNPSAYVIESGNMISYTIILTSSIFLLNLGFDNIQSITVIYSTILIIFFFIRFFYDFIEMSKSGVTDTESILNINMGAAFRHASFRIGLSLSLISGIKHIDQRDITSFSNIVELITITLISFFIYQVLRKVLIATITTVENPNKEIFNFGNTNLAKKESSVNIATGFLILLIL